MEPAAAPSTAAVVLAGGASERFGSDKTQYVVDGRSLLDRVVDAVAPLVDELLVVGPWAPAGRRHVLEPERYEGPLAGLAFGLRQVAAPSVLVLAADHPSVEPALVQLLLGRLAGGAADAVVPQRNGRPEPLVAAYRTTVAADAAERLLATGVRRLTALVEALDVLLLPEDGWRTADPDGRSFHDIDTPADLGFPPTDRG